MNKKLVFKVASSIYSRITDGTHDSPEPQSHGKPLITSKHIKGRDIDFDNAYLISEEDFTKINEKSYVDKWDVIVSMIGEYCGFCYVERNDTIDYAVKNVGLYKTGSKLEAEWLYYYLNSPIGKGHLNSIKSGSSQPYLTLGGLRSLPILQPQSSYEKRQIVNILSCIDSKISLNNRINAELEAMAKTIYDYWFVQFDFPTPSPSGRAGVGLPYKASGGKMVWSDELKREIPEGWEVNDISRYISVKDGTHDSPKYTQNGYKLITSKNLKIEGLDFDGANFISEQDYFEINKRSKVDTGDILFSMIGNIGTIYKVEEVDINFAVKNVAIFKSSEKFHTRNFIYMFLKSSDMSRYMVNTISGSIQKFIGLGDLRKIPVFVENDVIIKYSQITKAIFLQMENVKLQNQKLTELRDWLLPMLMNGQIKIKDAEQELAMAAEPEVEYKAQKKSR